MAEAKRGRPALPEAERRQQIGVRTSPSLKADLERAAGENGRSVAQEAELRLIASFEADRRAGSVETVRLLQMAADRIASIERLTGKRWHRDLTTWAAVADAFAKGPIQQFRPDLTTDDDAANEAWDRLWAIMEEKRSYVETLRSSGLYVPHQAEQKRSEATDALGVYSDAKRNRLRAAIKALDVTEDERVKLMIALTSLVLLDDAEKKARASFEEAIRPFIDAEKRGREIYRGMVAQDAARSAALSLAAQD